MKKRTLAAALMALLLWTMAWADVATPVEPTPAPTAEPAEDPTAQPATGVASVGNMRPLPIERKKTVTLTVPVVFSVGTEQFFSNMLQSGSLVDYDPARSIFAYSQDIANALSSLTVELMLTEDIPFYKKHNPGKRTVLGTLSDGTAAQLGFEKKTENGQTVYKDPFNGKTYPAGTRFNTGFAVFPGLVVSSSVRNGRYEVPVKIRWESPLYGSGSANATVYAQAENSDVPEKTTGGGGGGGYSYSGGGSASSSPAAKLIIRSVATNPANPTAGEEFDLLLRLHNTSETASVGNISISCEAEADAVLPVSGAFGAYVESIGPGKAFEQAIRVRAQSDIPDAPVKIYVSIDYEDKNANALNVTQTVVVNVSQLMRIKIDDPVLPPEQPIAGESYPITMGVFNLGRTTLYNVTVQAQTDSTELSAGASYYCGNMESGTSKTAELKLTPFSPGAYAAELLVTYENARGETFQESRTVSFAAQSYEEDDWFSDEPEDMPTPSPAPAPGRMAMEIAAILPVWAYAVVGGAFVLLVTSIGVRVRHRRLRAMEDDALD